MIPFFRKLRKKFLSENRVTKYLVYALGEIILVVIGILIALQVNTWNEARKDHKEGQQLQANIHREFVRNRQLLDTVLQLNQSAYNANLALLDLVGADAIELSRHNLDSLFYFSLASESYLPARNVVDDALRTGRIDLIGNDSLKNILMQWDTDYDVIQIYKNEQTKWQNGQMLQFMNRYISLRQIERYGGKPWYKPSKLPFEYKPLFELLEFENILDNNIYFLNFVILRLQEIRQTQEEILALTAGDGS